MGRWTQSWVVFGFCLLLYCCSGVHNTGEWETDPPYIQKYAYSENEFPNPAVDFEECGIDVAGFVCDPGRSLLKSKILQLNHMILSLRQSKTCLCDNSGDCREDDWHSIKIAIVPRIKYVSGGFPNSTEAEISAVRQFAEYIRDYTWKSVGWCDMQVWTAINVYASKVISNDQANETGNTAKAIFFSNGNIFLGLEDMVTKYRAFLDAGIPPKFTWWQILLIVISVLAAVNLLIALFVYAGWKGWKERRGCNGSQSSLGVGHSSYGTNGGDGAVGK